MTRLAVAINDLPFLISHRLPVLQAAREVGFTVAVAAPDHPPSVERLRAAGIAFWNWPLSRSGLSPWGELRSMWSLATFYRKWRPDLVHHVTPKPVLYGSIAARLAGVSRVVNAISGLGYVFSATGDQSNWLRHAMLLGHRLAHAGEQTRVIFQNPDDQAVLVDRRLVSRRRTLLIKGSGVDPLYWSPAVQLEPAPVVTVACRMLRDKGVADAVDACELVRHAGGAVALQLAGGLDPGNPRAISEATLHGWTTAGAANWLGPVQDMVALWRRTRIACLPTYYGEGIPKALIEAASCGLPIVTCDVPGCREIVKHEDNGLLVPPRQPQALAGALRRLLNDPALCERMGRRGRERVERDFSLATVVRQHLDLYRSLFDASTLAEIGATKEITA
jgi:glycosyltransferase involved in cell wall biosynthesis